MNNLLLAESNLWEILVLGLVGLVSITGLITLVILAVAGIGSSVEIDDDSDWKEAVPDECPITGRPFLMLIEHPDFGWLPTYGGPATSFTIPECDQETSVLSVLRYDHSNDAWVEGSEIMGMVVVPKARLESAEYALQRIEAGAPPEKIAKLISEWRATLPLNSPAPAGAVADDKPDVALLDNKG